MPRLTAKHLANRQNIHIRWSKAIKRSCPEPDSEVPDIENQINDNFNDSDSVCLNCAKREQRTFVSIGTQTIESYNSSENSTRFDWFVDLFMLLLTT